MWQSLRRPIVESLHIDTTPFRNKWDCWESSAQNWRRYLCDIVAIGIGRKISGQIPWNVIPTCEIFRTDCLMGRVHTKGDLVNHLKDPSIHFVTEWISSHIHERSVKNPSIWKESAPNNLPRLCIVRGCESGKEKNWLWILRSWKRWTHRKSMLKHSTRKRWYCLKVVKITISQSQMEQYNLTEKISNWEHPPWYGSDQF